MDLPDRVHRPPIYEGGTVIPDFPFEPVGRDRNKYDAHISYCYCSENLNQIVLSQPSNVSKRSEIMRDDTQKQMNITPRAVSSDTAEPLALLNTKFRFKDTFGIM